MLCPGLRRAKKGDYGKQKTSHLPVLELTVWVEHTTCGLQDRCSAIEPCQRTAPRGARKGESEKLLLECRTDGTRRLERDSLVSGDNILFALVFTEGVSAHDLGYILHREGTEAGTEILRAFDEDVSDRAPDASYLIGSLFLGNAVLGGDIFYEIFLGYHGKLLLIIVIMNFRGSDFSPITNFSGSEKCLVFRVFQPSILK